VHPDFPHVSLTQRAYKVAKVEGTVHAVRIMVLRGEVAIRMESYCDDEKNQTSIAAKRNAYADRDFSCDTGGFRRGNSGPAYSGFI
jgi:hypothetical protein